MTHPGNTDRRMGRIVTGVLLVAIGGMWLVEAYTDVDVSWEVILPAALILVGLALVLGSSSGRHGGLISFGVVLTILVLLSAAIEVIAEVPLAGGIGERNEAPTEAATEYRWGVGKMVIDLTGTTEFPEVIEVSLVMGELVVVVPEGAVVEVRGTAGIGDVLVLGRSSAGFSPEVVETPPNPEFKIDARIVIGKVEVRTG